MSGCVFGVFFERICIALQLVTFSTYNVKYVAGPLPSSNPDYGAIDYYFLDEMDWITFHEMIIIFES